MKRKMYFVRSVLLYCLLILLVSNAIAQAPTNPSTNFSVNFTDGNRVRVSFTPGNGEKRIIVARANSAVTALPNDGTDYLADDFGSGNELEPGQYVVYEGTGSGNIFINGLSPATTYHFRVFEFNGTNFNTEYLTSEFLSGNASTLSTPNMQASNIAFSNVSGSGVTVSWTNGDGNGRLLVAKEGSAVDAEPEDLAFYSGSSSFGFGTQLGTGNYVVYSSSGSSTNISNLDPSKTYHFALFEYNGSSGRVFLRPGATASVATSSTPTVASTNFNTNFIDGNRFRYFFTRGDGERRLVIAKEGSPVTASPTDGESYVANAAFGSGEEVAPGEFVVYNGTGNSNIFLNNLEPSTTYHLRIFEYNGEGDNTFYLTSEFLNGSASTSSAPTMQSSDISFSNISGTGVTVSWTDGNGAGRLLVAKEGSAVDAEPEDLAFYSGSSSFGFGTQLGTGNYAVYSSSGSSTNISNLDPSKTYHFALFEYNGSSGRVFLRPGATGSVSTSSTPTTAPTNFNTNFIDGNRFRYLFTRGDGERRLVIAKEGSPVTASPTDGESYVANATFGSGEELATGEFVVYNGTGNSNIFLNNLEPSTTYHLRIFEYNGEGDNTFYLTSDFLTGSASTSSAPTAQGSDISFSNVSGTGVTVSWTNGDGNGRLLVAKEGSAVDAEPEDLVFYSGSSSFGFGTQLGTGNYVVYSSSGSSTNISNLEPNKTYHFALFEYNGSSGRVFLRPGARASVSTSTTPTIAATNFNTNLIDGNRFRYLFTRGNGERRLVIAKEGSPVTASPTDGESYVANAAFGSGEEVAPGEFVVYNGTGNFNIFLNNLEPSTTYHLKIYEYNGEGDNTFYLTSEFLSASQSTSSTPTVQSSNAFLSSRGTTTLNVSWTNGDGARRLLIGRKDGPVNIVPEDLTNYLVSSNFGSREINDSGNFALYNSTGNNVNISNLEAGTNYFFALFELNGNNAPVYLTPGYAFTLETFGERPTLQVSNAQFSNITVNSFDVDFTAGNGSRRLVVARANGSVTAGPSDFNSYSANNTLGQGDEIGNGNFVVYNDFGENFTLEGLEENTTYHLAFYEYALGTDGELYAAPPYTAAETTLGPPSQISSNFNVSPPCTNETDITWVNGNGDGRIVVISPEELTASPNDLTNYTANNTYGNGDAIGNGFVVYNGSGQSVSPTGLQNDENYFVSIFEYNGSGTSIFYNQTPLEGFLGDITAPTVICQDSPFELVLNEEGEATLNPEDLDNGSSDECGIASMELDRTMFTCSDVGTPIIVTLTVTDNFGNQATCQTTVNVSSGSANTWYADADGDGFGDENVVQNDCSQPEGYVENALDCDDTNSEINPDATEIPNDGIDQDCDGEDLVLDQVDLRITDIVSPNSGCDLGNSENVTVQIANNGTAATSTFEVAYRINETDPVVETVNLTIQPGAFANYTFTATADLSAVGVYNLEAYSIIAGDANPSNDNRIITVENFETTVTSISQDQSVCAGTEVTLTATGGTSYLWNTGATSASITVTPFITTQYSVQITGAGGCSVTESVTISISDGITLSSATVSPARGTPESDFQFSVTYTDPDGNLPAANFPQLELDANGDDDALDPLDRMVTLVEADAGDNDVTDGKVYQATLTELSTGLNYRYRFISENSAGCDGITNFTNGPIVSEDLLDISIFASDISFSKSNPALQEPIQIFASIRNTSDFNAENFQVSIYAEDDLLFTETDVSINPQSTITLDWTYAFNDSDFVPIKVVIDETNALEEKNELNNFAIRPIIVGDYVLPGGIEVDAALDNSTVIARQIVTISGSANYFGLEDDVDLDVSGATIELFLDGVKIRQTVYTDSEGFFRTSFRAPLTPGNFLITGKITDYTLSAEFGPLDLEILPPPPLPDLRAEIQVSPSTVFEGEEVSGVATVSNVGEFPVGEFTFEYVYSDGVLGTEVISGLNPGESLDFPFSVTLSNGTTCSTSPNYQFNAKADSNNEIEEVSEGNNLAVTQVKALVTLPDLVAGIGAGCGLEDDEPYNFSVSLRNVGGVSTSERITVNVYINDSELIDSRTFNGLGLCETEQFNLSYNFQGNENQTITVKVDEANTIGELSEANNNSTTSPRFCPPPPPITNLNISIYDLAVEPKLPLENQLFDVVATFRNNGDLDVAEPFDVNFIITENGNERVYTTRFTEGLNAGEETTLRTEISIAGYGDHLYAVLIDAQDEIDESSNLDNYAEMPLCVDFTPRPAGSVWAGNFYSGSEQQLTARIRNLGIFTGTDVKVSFYLNGEEIAADVIPEIGPTYFTSGLAVRVPYVFPESGRFELSVKVDSPEDYIECDEDNNIYADSITILNPAPDLRVISEYISPTELNPDLNEPINIFLSFENVGIERAPAFKARVAVDDQPLGSMITVPALDPGEDGTVAIAAPYSSATGGVKIIRGFVDSDNEIEESNETNNEASRAIIVGEAPNLLFTNIDFSNCPESGDLVTINTDIFNEGDVNATADVTYFYITEQLDTIPIRTVSVSVQANSTTSSSIDWTVVNREFSIYALISNSDPQEYDVLDNDISGEFCEVPLISYALDINRQGLGLVRKSPTQTRYTAGSVVELEAIPAEGWYFEAFSGDLSGTDAQGSLTMDADKNVTAIFKELASTTYALNVSIQGEGTVTKNPDKGAYDEGETVELVATPAAGWMFEAWDGDASGDNNQLQLTMDESKNIVARFVRILNTYSLETTTIGQGEIAITPDKLTFQEGEVVTLTALADEGWTFSTWTGDLENELETVTLIMDSDKQITAVFEEIADERVNLVVNTVGQGSVLITPDQNDYEPGTLISLTAEAAEGWTFVSWSGEGAPTESEIDFIIRSDTVITATFEEVAVEQFTLTINVVGEGSVTANPDLTTYESGTEVILNAFPNELWEFVGWTGDVVNQSESVTLIMDADKEVTATFAEAPPVVVALQFTSVCSDDPEVQRRWRVRNPNSFVVDVDWEVFGTDQTGSITAQSGDNFFVTNTVEGSNTTKIFWENERGEIQVLTKASGGASCNPDPVDCYGNQIISFNQGKRRDGRTIESRRSNPENALGAPQENDTYNFVSLGFGGTLTMKLGEKVYDDGSSNPDFIVVETSFGRADQKCFSDEEQRTGRKYPEEFTIEVSQDGNFWHELSGLYCRTSFIDISETVDMMGYVEYIRITDQTDRNFHSGSADGFDVDGVIVCPDLVAEATGRLLDARIASSGASGWDPDFFNTLPDDPYVVSAEIYPNPVKDHMNMRLTADQDMEAVVQVYTLAGVEVIYKSLTLLEGPNETYLDLREQRVGMYLVKIIGSDGKIIDTFKVLKQR